MRGYRHDAGDARAPVAGAAADDGRLRRRAGAHAEGRRHGGGARPGGTHARRGAAAPSSTSSPIPTIRWRTTTAPAPRSGATPAAPSRTSSRAMGTTGTIMGVSRFLKEKNPAIADHRLRSRRKARRSRASASGREAYLPKIYDPARVDRLETRVSQADAEDMARRLAREEGIFCGISSGGACAVALRIAREVENATIVFDRLRSRRPLPVDRRLPRLMRPRRRLKWGQVQFPGRKLDLTPFTSAAS